MSPLNPTADRDCPHCPSGDELLGLIDGQLAEERQTALSDHVGDCPGCREKLDALATGGNSGLSDVVRHIDRMEPPSDSAFWRALGQAESALTREFVAEIEPPTGEIKLDFLQRTEKNGRIGRVGSFVIENRHITTEQAEERVERQAREFELLKPYLVQRWTAAIDGA